MMKLRFISCFLILFASLGLGPAYARLSPNAVFKPLAVSGYSIEAKQVGWKSDKAAATYVWAAVTSPDAYALKSIDMVSPDEGWAVGYQGRASNGTPTGSIILKWNGITWDEWFNSSDSALPFYS